MEGITRTTITVENLSFQFMSTSRGLRKIIIAKVPLHSPHPRPDPDLEENFLLAFYGRPHKLPELDIEGLTDFRKQVLAAIRNIPFGRTMTYKEIAIMIGRPKALRAVGQALNWNPIPIFFP